MLIDYYFKWWYEMFVDYKEVGRRIAKRRKELKLKQSEVNELADLSDKYLSNIETGKSIPSIDVLMRICEAIQTTPDSILVGSTKRAVSSEKSEIFSEKFSTLSERNQKLVIHFMDWIAEEEKNNN